MSQKKERPRCTLCSRLQTLASKYADRITGQVRKFRAAGGGPPGQGCESCLAARRRRLPADQQDEVAK